MLDTFDNVFSLYFEFLFTSRLPVFNIFSEAKVNQKFLSGNACKEKLLLHSDSCFLIKLYSLLLFDFTLQIIIFLVVSSKIPKSGEVSFFYSILLHSSHNQLTFIMLTQRCNFLYYFHIQKEDHSTSNQKLFMGFMSFWRQDPNLCVGSIA